MITYLRKNPGGNTAGRYECFTAVLPDNQLMVVGGFTDDSGKLTDTVELATMRD